MVQPRWRVSRRELVKAGVGASLLWGTGDALAACGSSASSSTSSAATTAKPKRGGTLHVALTGGSSSDTLDAQALVTEPDQARIVQLYNSPTEFDLNGHVQLSLAEEISPNAAATEWMLRVRPGITFHNGKDLTADDVIFSFQRITNAKNPKPGAAQLSLLDVKGIKKLDSHTVVLPFTRPFSPLAQLLADFYYFIVPVGYDPAKPVGTGPFKLKSFTPGSQSVFVRNENYWESGLPYADEVIISDYPDETSQVNALLGGQVNLVGGLSATSGDTVRSQGQRVVQSNSGSYTPFTMRVDVAPFNDVRVRQALRYVADRPQMLRLIFGGQGLVGNDLYSINDPTYDHAIPQRVQDLEKARSLLKSAGHSGLNVQLAVAPIAAGVPQAAQLFAQNAQGAGITVNLRSVTPTEMFGPNYLKWPFAFDTWPALYYLTNAGEGVGPGAPYNETHFANPQYDRLYNEALSTLDAAKQTDLIHAMQEIEYNEGGYIIPYFVPLIDAHAPNVEGVMPSKEVFLSNWSFKHFWLS